jgi:predicted DNA-binding transcriptional regulator AlpA
MPSNSSEHITPLDVSITHACILMSLSRSTFYRRQGAKNFPLIRKEETGRRRYVNYKEIVSWSEKLGRISK